MLDFHILQHLAKEIYQKFGNTHSFPHTKYSHWNTRIAAIHLRPHLYKEAVTGTARKPTSLWRSLRKCDFLNLNYKGSPAFFIILIGSSSWSISTHTTFIILGFPYNCYGFGILQLTFCIICRWYMSLNSRFAISQCHTVLYSAE